MAELSENENTAYPGLSEIVIFRASRQVLDLLTFPLISHMWLVLYMWVHAVGG